jgi:hypothetical protein
MGQTSGQQRPERPGFVPDGPADSRSHVRFPCRAPASTPRVPPPAAQWVLDADNDDAVVRQGGVQRGIRAGRSVPASARCVSSCR